MNRHLAGFACCLLLPGLVACSRSYGDVRPYAPMAPMQVLQVHQPVASGGSLYRTGTGLNLYSDRRARDVGDLLTINLIENTAAQTTADTTVDKSGNIEMAAPNIAGAPVTYGGRDVLSASLNGARGFSGSGNSAQSNRLQGSITVTVVQRLPNGNLLVQGQKNMRLNQGDELVQIQGIVRSADINPDNTVPSSRVADARIAYGGRGAVAQSNSMGWLGRFFNSPIFPN